MEAKSETSVAITLTRDELKALIKEAVKEALTEMLKHPSNSAPKSVLSDKQFESLLNETSERYKEVWKALA
jgi:lipoate-protein ligase A